MEAVNPRRLLRIAFAFFRACRGLQNRKRLGLPVEPVRIPLRNPAEEPK
jgi:hypothetical protein